MPKFLVTMNYVEAKRTSFVVEAENEDDVYDGLGEIDTDFFENHDNLKWICSDYEPPIIDGVVQLKNTERDATSCTVKQQTAIQQEFDKALKSFN